MRRVYDLLGTWANRGLSLKVHPEGYFGVSAALGVEAHLYRSAWAVTILGPSGREVLESTRMPIQDLEEGEVETPLGPARRVRVTHKPSRSGCGLFWQALVYREQPYIAIQVGAVFPAAGVRLERLSPLLVAPPHGQVAIPELAQGWTFFVEGWHSWSFSGVLRGHQRQPGSRLARFDGPTAYDVGHPPPRKPGHFLSHGVGVLKPAARGPALVVGWPRQWDFVGLVEVEHLTDTAFRLSAWADGEGIPLREGEIMWSEPLIVQFVPPEEPDPLAGFADALARLSQARVPSRPPVGWCSWYHFFQNITPDAIRRNVKALAALREQVPVEVVQIDDGYEAAVGDWLEQKPAFAGQMAQLAAEIREAGFRPGLWLAPFIVSPRARVFRDHPDWLVRDARGRPVNAGFLWNRFTTALDVTHPGVEAYVREVIETVVHRWGYTYLKLDFLYAAALPGRRYRQDMTRVQALRRGLAVIRETAGDDVFILGCGCPLGPAVGLVDAMRIGPDIAPHWYPRLYGLSRPWRGKVTYPAGVNAVRNTLTRAFYHRRAWWNDPDCILVRTRDNRLTPEEVQAWLSVVGLTGGLVVWSDDLEAVPAARRAWVAALLPPQPERATVVDALDKTWPEVVALPLKRSWGEGVTVGIFNWQEHAAPRVVPLASLGIDPRASYHAFDFWHGRYFRVEDGQLVFPAVAPHSGHVIGLKPLKEEPHLVASTFHITQGAEISDWEWHAPRLRFRVVIGRRARGRVLVGCESLQLKAVPPDVRVCAVAPGVVALEFDVDGERTVEVSWA